MKMTEFERAVAWFLLGAFLGLVILVQLDAFGPSLGERISEGICYRIGGAWDSVERTCIQEH